MAMAIKSIKLYKIMKGKFTEEEAADIVECMQPIISEERLNSFATKDDIKNLKDDIKNLKDDFKNLRDDVKDVRVDIRDIRKDIEALVDSDTYLNNEFADFKLNMHKWFIGTGIALASLIIAAGGLLYSAL